MTNVKLGRWLLVVIAIVGLAFAPGLVGAHGNETVADDAPLDDGPGDDMPHDDYDDMPHDDYDDMPHDDYDDMPHDDHGGDGYGQGHC